MSTNPTNSSAYWFLLVDSDGQPVKGSNFTSISGSSITIVDEFRSEVKKTFSNLLSSVDAPEMRVYKDKN